MNFEIIRANIIDIPADAVVLPANEKLKEGSGASKAIFEAAGRKQLKKACEEWGHCDMGLAVPTPAYDLNAMYVIHAVVPHWKDGQHDEYGLLSSAYLSSLKLAEIMECESIAFPLLASGNNKFDRALAFQIAIESITSFEATILKKVILVVYGENMECFVKSQGYQVSNIPETVSSPKSIFSDKIRRIAKNGLNKGIEWIKDKENQKKVVQFGLAIALAVLKKDSKGAKIVETVKQIKK